MGFAEAEAAWRSLLGSDRVVERAQAQARFLTVLGLEVR